MKNVLLSLLLGLLGLSSLQSNAQDLYFPPIIGAWDTLPPDSLGWCEPQLADLHAFLDERDTRAFIALKGGRLVLEWYFQDFGQDSLWYWASAGKTMTATLVGIAQQEGLLDIHSPTSDYLGTGWTACDSAEEAEITPWHQLTMTTGMDETVPDLFCTDDSCLSCLTDPGTRWYYHNGPYTLLTNVIEEAVPFGSINQFFLNRIGLTTGMLGSYVQAGYNRLFVSRARDMARFGLLMLAKGNWNGVPVLSDTAYYQEMTTPSQSLNRSYGYLWWLNGQADHRLPGSSILFTGSIIPTAPDDLIAGLGANDQKLYVLPSQDLVIIRLGESAGPSQLSLSSFDEDLWTHISSLACSPSTSVAEASQPQLTVSPNPTEGLLRITSERPVATLRLYDLQGRVMGQYEEDLIDMKIFPKGLYLLRWETADGQIGWERVEKR